MHQSEKGFLDTGSKNIATRCGLSFWSGQAQKDAYVSQLLEFSSDCHLGPNIASADVSHEDPINFPLLTRVAQPAILKRGFVAEDDHADIIENCC